ncbi:hypothetical protein T484DRAFT_1794007 [Baffinella frigidus]|nr:hypothetical protein T484DRAFT_1794007 [Cryptophyta sp. CCMP2293]
MFIFADGIEEAAFEKGASLSRAEVKEHQAAIQGLKGELETQRTQAINSVLVQAAEASGAVTQARRAHSALQAHLDQAHLDQAHLDQEEIEASRSLRESSEI